jgi:hypothetical protein
MAIEALLLHATAAYRKSVGGPSIELGRNRRRKEEVDDYPSRREKKSAARNDESVAVFLCWWV